MRLNLKRGDLGLIVFLLIIIIFLSVYGYFKSIAPYDNIRVVITANKNRLIKKFYKKPEKIEIKGRRGMAVILIGSNWVQMLDSACPNKLCVKQGKIYKIGQQIICLPNAISIKIEAVDMKNFHKGVDSICH